MAPIEVGTVRHAIGRVMMQMAVAIRRRPREERQRIEKIQRRIKPSGAEEILMDRVMMQLRDRIHLPGDHEHAETIHDWSRNPQADPCRRDYQPPVAA